ncbi:MAG: DNA polymerase/3'-5' exonuclease PolX [Planctomycetota bacterium]
MNNAEIAATFDQVADILEFQGANPFRVRAYRNAARTVHDLDESIAEIAADPERRIDDLKGIGDDLAEKIRTLLETGKLPMLEELRAEVPESVMAMLRVPGLGPKRAATIFKELGVSTLAELREACQQQRVRALKGFGAKMEQTILAGLDIAAEAEHRVLWAEADEYVQSIAGHLQKSGAVNEVVAAGSYRRGKDTVGDLDFLALAPDTDAAMDALASVDGVADILARGDTKMSLRLRAGLQVDLRVVPEESFGAALVYFTGSKDHNIVIRGRAKDRGLKINEYGVFHGEEMVAGRTEEEVYATLDLPWIPPELREARQEFEWADAGTLPALVELSDIRGDLHMHSTWTDGLNTIEEMAAAAKSRGLKYIAITDHSKRVAMVGGLNGDRLRKQWEEIDRIREGLKGITLLKGVEVDILEQGGLDIEDEVLAEADWVVASLHYGHNQPRSQITRRAVEALEHPSVCAIAHPTGRMLMRRRPYEIDLEAVMQAAVDNGKFLELNAHPTRLDLDDVACAAAKRRGVPIVISTDAHKTDGLAAMRYGVLQARRGGLTKADVVNSRSWSEVKKMVGRKG